MNGLPSQHATASCFDAAPGADLRIERRGQIVLQNQSSLRLQAHQQRITQIPPSVGPGHTTPAWLNTCYRGRGVGQKQPNEHPAVTLWSPRVWVEFTGLARPWGNVDPKPDEDHSIEEMQRAVSQDPIWIRDLARQVHRGLEWQAHRSAEPIIGKRRSQQQQTRQHIFQRPRNTTYQR